MKLKQGLFKTTSLLKFATNVIRSTQDNKKFLTLKAELKDLTKDTVRKTNLKIVIKKRTRKGSFFMAAV